jgi:ATP-dependent Clp protease ATP-binding subunit ClpX
LHILNNKYIYQTNNPLAQEKSVILIDGASGTGKTAIAKYIASEIDIPCVKKSVTVFSKVGYEGESLTGMLVDLVSKAHGDLKKAEHGIVIIDEIGTVATKDPTQDRMKREIQNELLDFLGGGKYDIYYQNQKMEFDTSTLTFIGLASFTELRKQKIKEAMENYQYTDADAKISFLYQDTGSVVPFGFKVDLEEPTEETIEYDITKEDLVNYGYQDDLINRFNTFIHTKDYDKETLKHIITHSSTSPFLGLKEWIKLYGKKPIVEEETIDLIAEKAYELHSGARGIETVIEAIKDRILESTMLGNNKNIYITSELVEAACKGISHHEGRRRS